MSVIKRLSTIQGVRLEGFHCIRSEAVKLGHTVFCPLWKTFGDRLHFSSP